MTQLARKLTLWNYFALGFGTMIGTGWVLLMDDWLGRGGPLGAMLGFALGGILLLPIGYVYGQWVRRLPDAAGEALLKQAIARFNLSARAYHRILKVARTVADLAGDEHIATRHIAETIQYRRLAGG